MANSDRIERHFSIAGFKTESGWIRKAHVTSRETSKKNMDPAMLGYYMILSKRQCTRDGVYLKRGLNNADQGGRKKRLNVVALKAGGQRTGRAAGSVRTLPGMGIDTGVLFKMPPTEDPRTWG